MDTTKHMHLRGIQMALDIMCDLLYSRGMNEYMFVRRLYDLHKYINGIL